METVRDLARQAIVRNTIALRDAMGLHPVAEKQWWNLPAKVGKAAEIARDEKLRFQRLAEARRRELGVESGPGHNDDIDAMRHAETSRRVASEVDPRTAEVLGNAVEAGGWLRAVPATVADLIHRRPIPDYRAEMEMDLHNNAQGRAAAAAGRPVDPRTLQNAPRR